MIHVSCGSLQSIGLEAFLNFFTSLEKSEKSQYCLHINHKVLNTYAKKSSCSFRYLQINDIATTENDLCLESFLSALNSIKKNDFLLTLPANKADLYYNKQQFMGHTEFLRTYWKINELPMTFIAPKLILLLLTDHTPLKNVSSIIKTQYIIHKISLFLNSYPKAKFIKRVKFWGINPHAGENNLLGHEENEIKLAIKKLTVLFPNIAFVGPVSSDGNFSLLPKSSLSPDEILVSPYHDQGLVFLKSVIGFLASNCTFGGPVIRISPDHGTAIELLHKRQALYTSLMWCHQLLMSWGNHNE